MDQGCGIIGAISFRCGGILQWLARGVLLLLFLLIQVRVQMGPLLLLRWQFWQTNGSRIIVLINGLVRTTLHPVFIKGIFVIARQSMRLFVRPGHFFIRGSAGQIGKG
jgi:hypothetical protein